MIATRSIPREELGGRHGDRESWREIVDLVSLYLPLSILFAYMVGRAFAQLFHS